jgi:hypothetical protein
MSDIERLSTSVNDKNKGTKFDRHKRWHSWYSCVQDEQRAVYDTRLEELPVK